MKLSTRLFTTATLALFSLALVVPSFAQAPASAGSAGKYGLTAWAINNQRVASQYNYYIDSNVSQGAVLGLFQFPAATCQQALAFGGGKNVNPFNTNASVKVVDIVSANTETVTLNSVTISGGVCSLSLATSNTHSADSYVLRSGTCGLKEAQNDKGAVAGTIIVDQKFYDDGCSASTITALSGGTSGDLILDESNGKFDVYSWTGSAFQIAGSLGSTGALFSASITPAATSAAIQTAAQTFTFTGLPSGADVTLVSQPAPTSLCPAVAARATALNTLSIYFTTLTAAACTPASGTYKVLVTP